ERALRGYRPAYLGIDVAWLLDEGEAWATVAETEPPATWTERRRPPRLTIDETSIRGDEPELAG
ncbi:MAG: hypothetical protein ACRELV_07050, partial [Longimicrobiales bacterium]